MPMPWEKGFWSSGKGTDIWDIASGGLATEGAKRRVWSPLRETAAELPVVGGLFGESGSDRMLREGEEAMQRGVAQARGDITPLYEQAIGAYEPYTGMAGALPSLQKRAMSGEFTPQMQAFNFQADPGYQFALEEGLKGGQRGLAAMGLSGSGREAKELSRFATGLAGQQYGQAFNRNLQQQQLAAQLGQQRYGQEFGLGQLGLSQLGEQQQARMGLAGLYSDLAVGSAQARADRLAAQAAARRQGASDLMSLGGALGAAALSDVRVKQNLKPTGRKENGFNIWEFEYKDQPGKRFSGVMAQEVELVNPEAVGLSENGYKTVNYDMIGVEMRAL